MKQMSIMLTTIHDVKEFVSITSLADFDVDAISGRYAVDAKSIIGLFSLDLGSPLTLNIYSDDCDGLVAALRRFAVE